VSTSLKSIVNSIGGFGLSDSAQISTPSKDVWLKIAPDLSNRRLTGLGLAAWEAGAWSLDDEQAENLLERHQAAMVHALEIERRLLAAARALDEAQIEFAVIKGSAVAHAFYQDPSWRPFGDLDLLVRGNQWRAASAVIESLGYRRRLPEPKAGFDERFGKAAEFVHDGFEVDLHRTLVLGPFGLWINPRDLASSRDSFSLGGRRLPRLGNAACLLNACAHAVLGWWPPLQLPLRDVLQIATYPHLDWHRVWDLARRWRLRAVVERALVTASEMLGVELPPTAATSRDRARLSQLRALKTNKSGANRGVLALSTLRAIPGITKKIAYGRALAFPDREFVAARSGGKPAYLKRWRTGARLALARNGSGRDGSNRKDPSTLGDS
jgi:hypothetical protein